MTRFLLNFMRILNLLMFVLAILLNGLGLMAVGVIHERCQSGSYEHSIWEVHQPKSKRSEAGKAGAPLGAVRPADVQDHTIKQATHGHLWAYDEKGVLAEYEIQDKSLFLYEDNISYCKSTDDDGNAKIVLCVPFSSPKSTAVGHFLVRAEPGHVWAYTPEGKLQNFTIHGEREFMGLEEMGYRLRTDKDGKQCIDLWHSPSKGEPPPPEK